MLQYSQSGGDVISAPRVRHKTGEIARHHVNNEESGLAVY